ncbi:MAG: hypothetical protein R2749_14335 [Acidimicrobiales bacterium]
MSSGRRLWLVVGGAVAALLLGYGALTAIELLTTTTRTEQLTLPPLDGVRRLRLDSAGGSVTVIGDDRGAGAISGTVRLRERADQADPRRAARRRRRIGADEPLRRPVSITCDATYQLSTREAWTWWPTRRWRLPRRRPRRRPVDLQLRWWHRSNARAAWWSWTAPAVASPSTAAPAVVSAEVLRGRHPPARQRIGHRVAGLVGGGVTAEFAEAPTSVRASSSGGGVTVELPDGVDAYRVDARSSGGSQQVRVRTDPAAERTIVVSSSGGDVDVRYRPG